MSIQEHIDLWINEHRKEYVEDVKRLVAIKSVKGEAHEGEPYGAGPARALEEAMKLCEKYGFEAVNYDNHAIAADMNPLTPGLDILAHLDVVGEGEGWDTNPYKAVEKNGLLYGRGTSDDKGPAVAALYAMRCLREIGVPLKRNVRLILGADEESGSDDMLYYYSKEKAAPNTFSPDSSFPVINIEKGSYKPVFKKSWSAETVTPRLLSLDGGFRINVLPAKASAEITGISKEDAEKKCAGLCPSLKVSYEIKENGGNIIITVNGTGAHASAPDSGVNGITALIAILCALPFADCESTRTLKALSELFPHGDGKGCALGIAMSDDISGELTVAFSLLNFTSTGMCGQFDSRVPICANDDNCRKTAEKAFRKYGFEVAGEMHKPHHTPENGKFVQTLLKAYEIFTGEKGKCEYMGGGTYVHDVEGGVAFGAEFPGFESNMHGANEKMSIDDMLKAAKIYAYAVYQLCK